ncbi:MAG: inositol monophosphatase family protein [Patescibacteria group bacterium]|mgnify:FL=1
MTNNLLNFTIKTARKAGELILKSRKKGLQINEKGRNDLVTNVDKAAEKLIIKEIKSAFPSHSILAEESDFLNETTPEDYAKSKFIWLIDPIDGTTNFAHGLNEYAISIGLFKTAKSEHSKNFQYLSGELIMGVVFAPALNELFYAKKGKGAYLNDKKIKISNISKLKNSLLATGFPYNNRKRNLPYFSTMIDQSQAIRRLGAASLDLCYVAMGRFDGYWEFDLKPWDIAAGTLIVKEAGGKITDTNGNMLDLFGKDILATNGKIHQEMIKAFKKL